MSDCDRCKGRCDTNCQQEWCGSVENTVYHAAPDNSQQLNQSDRLSGEVKSDRPVNFTSLRDRIAAAIESESMRDLTYNEAYAMADAVIAELRLRQEWGIKECGEPEPGWLDETRQFLADKVRPGELLMRRHITDWEADDGTA